MLRHRMPPKRLGLAAAICCAGIDADAAAHSMTIARQMESARGVLHINMGAILRDDARGTIGRVFRADDRRVARAPRHWVRQPRSRSRDDTKTQMVLSSCLRVFVAV